MPIAPINRAKTIALPLDVNSGDTIHTIYENSGLSVNSELIQGHTIIGYNVFVKNLKAFSQINSLPEIALPNFELTDSETTKLYKTLNVEWQSARKQLNLFIGTSNSWNQIGSVSILNPSGYPFRIYSLLDLFTDNLYFELGENGRIGVQVQEVGYGLLSGNDSIVIHGSYVEEIFVRYADTPNIINITNSGLPGSNTPATPVLTIPVTPIGGNNEMSNWLVKTENYSILPSDKVLAFTDSFSNPGPITLVVPFNPPSGSTFKVLRYGGYNVDLNFGGVEYNGLVANIISVPYSEVEYTFVYISDTHGWMGTMLGGVAQ